MTFQMNVSLKKKQFGQNDNISDTNRSLKREKNNF